jgi:hypothetical protein
MFRLCSNDSSVLCRCPTPRKRACGPCGLSLLPPSCNRLAVAGISEVSRFSCMKFLAVFWGLRLRRSAPRLALSSRFMLPSAYYNCVGVLIASFRSSIAQPAYSPVYASLCTSRYPTQNSGPSGSLLLSRGVSSTPASYRFSPAHCNRLFATITNPSTFG